MDCLLTNKTLIFDREKIHIDEDQMFEDMQNAMREAQRRAIKKYGSKFTTYEFYSKITQDREYINIINLALNKFKIHIDYFSREKDNVGKWIIDTLYLPIYVVEPE